MDTSHVYVMRAEDCELNEGVCTVTTHEVPEQLKDVPTPCKWVIVQAQTDNTDVVAVGGPKVLATVATGTGVALAAGESITLPVRDLMEVWIDAVVDGEGVRYTYGI